MRVSAVCLAALACGGVSGFMMTAAPKPSSTATVVSRRQFAAAAVAGVAAAAPALAWAADSKAPRSPKVYETDNGVLYIIKEEGKGAGPREGDLVAIKYIGYLNNGKAFDINDGSVPGRKPVVFKLGAKQVIPGFEEIVRYMRPGATYNIVVPSKLGYGDKGVCVGDGECLIPPNETLKYTLTLDRVAVSPLP